MYEMKINILLMVYDLWSMGSACSPYIGIIANCIYRADIIEIVLKMVFSIRTPHDNPEHNQSINLSFYLNIINQSINLSFYLSIISQSIYLSI